MKKKWGKGNKEIVLNDSSFKEFCNIFPYFYWSLYLVADHVRIDVTRSPITELELFFSLVTPHSSELAADSWRKRYELRIQLKVFAFLAAKSCSISHKTFIRTDFFIGSEQLKWMSSACRNKIHVTDLVKMVKLEFYFDYQISWSQAKISGSTNRGYTWNSHCWVSYLTTPSKSPES